MNLVTRSAAPAIAIVLAAATGLLVPRAVAIEAKPYKAVDFLLEGPEPLYDCYLNYYYYIPCPTSSWFWGFSGWEPQSSIGTWFLIGDVTMFDDNFYMCDPFWCHTLEYFQVLDFAGYGAAYPGLYTVQFEIYCADDEGCPVGSPVWESGPVETEPGWNLILPDGPIYVSDCRTVGDGGAAYDRFLIVATHIGSDCTFPEWGYDNISYSVLEGCEMHDYSSRAAIYPRPQTSPYSSCHSGYYGQGFEYCPPLFFADPGDTTLDAGLYGVLEAAWRVFIVCEGQTTEPTTWGSIKGMYR